jgi:glycosyltransferase involved in cell wall biosynthesis
LEPTLPVAERATLDEGRFTPARRRITGPREPRERPLRVAIAHDFMETYGGAERVTAEIAAAFPQARVYAILGRDDVAERMGVGDRWRPLLRARNEHLFRNYRKLAPFFPRFVDGVELPEADVLVSSSYAFAHRLRTENHAPHVCYLHSPLRFAWSMTESYRDVWAPGGLRAAAFDAMARHMRAGDRRAARRVTSFLTQSQYVAGQIEEFYGREATVVGAPVDCSRFRPNGKAPEDFFLFCGRLIEPYKKVGVVLEAFSRLRGERLVIAGDGPAMAELRARATPNVEFVGHVDDDAVVDLMQRAKATVFPSRDDFGLVPVEAMACGRPVIAYAGGGALYTVADGVTGAHVAEQTADAFTDALRSFDPAAFDPWAIRLHALQWDRPAFRERMVAAVEAALPRKPQLALAA